MDDFESDKGQVKIQQVMLFVNSVPRQGVPLLPVSLLWPF